jgi:hypothetical protein
MTQRQLHIVEEQERIETTTDEQPGLEAGPDSGAGARVGQPARYAEAEEPDWDGIGRRAAGFLKNLLPEVGKADYVDDRQRIHHYEQLDELRVLDQVDTDATDDVDLGVLFVLPDETLCFIGQDPTTDQAPAQFGFTVEPLAPIPAPETAQDSLDLLRPTAVQQLFADGYEPDRQGEWWLLPTREVPVGTTFKPGVSHTPMGPSPLGNHVPTEWGMTRNPREFLQEVQASVDALPSSVATVPEVMGWLHRQHQRRPTPDGVPSWDVVQDIAGDILVRGTLRHRESDHYVESVGDDWHRAETHNMDVYTADQVNEVVLD